jgi:DNA topoisomerase I
MGEHPDEGGKMEVLEGKYGAYVSHNGVNATVPKARDPKTLTVTEAISLLAERIAKGGSKPKKGGRFGKAKPKAANGDAKAKPAAKAAAKAKPAAKKKAPAKNKADA